MMRTKSILVFAVLYLMSEAAFGLNGWTVTQVTDDYYDCINLSTSGTNAIWQKRIDDNTYQLEFWDGNMITVLDEDSYNFKPSISGENVTWTIIDSNSRYQMMFWDGNSTTQVTSYIPDNDILVRYSAISGTNVVWEEYDVAAGSVTHIMLWDGNTITQISGDGCHNPAISGTNVAYKEWVGPSYKANLIFWDGNTPSQLGENSDSRYQPAISGTNVTWQEYDSNDNTQIMFWDGDTTTQLSSGNFNCREQQISGTNVVWTKEIPAHSQIYFWDGNTTTELSGTDNSSSPSISGENVVWKRYYDNYYYVYFWDGNTTTELHATDHSINSPSIIGENVVWCEADGYNTYQIFLAERNPLPPTTCSEAIAMGYSLQFDFNDDCKVNIIDFAFFADDWLRCIDPNDANCEQPWE